MHTSKITHVCVVSTRLYRLIFTKRSANVERLVNFITVYSNCDGSIKGRCYGNRLMAPYLHSLRWHSIIVGGGRNVGYCSGTNTADDPSKSNKNFVNFGPVTSEILWWVCRRGWVHIGKNTHVCVCFHRSSWTDVYQTFSWLWLWNCDGSLERRCHGNRFVAHDCENWHTQTSFCALAFHNGWKDHNVDCSINTAVDPSRSGKNFLNFGSVILDS